MARSCSNTSFPPSRACSSSTFAAASSSSSTPASLSFQHFRHQLPSSSSSNKHAILHWECEKIIKQASHVSVTARQGQYDPSTKNTSQSGGRGAAKEEKAGRKGDSSGSKNFKAYNNNNSRLQINSNPKVQKKSPGNGSGQRLWVADVEEDEENHEVKSTSRKSMSYKEGDVIGIKSLSSRAKRGTGRLSMSSDEEKEEDEENDDDFEVYDDHDLASDGEASSEHLPMPIPPFGFVLAEDGSVSVMAPPHNRITTLVDPLTKLPLDCLIRRGFSSSDGRQCFLLCPLDTPLQILKTEDGEVLKEVQISDKELEDIIPTASYELAKRRLHLVQSGIFLTLRGGFCFSKDDVMDLSTVYGEVDDTTLSEGVVVSNFLVNDLEYLIFTPVEPLMFVAYKDEKTGKLLIAEDDLLDDEAVLDAINEEKEFQIYMEDDILTDPTSYEEEE